jgi:hypothetical protein
MNAGGTVICAVTRSALSPVPIGSPGGVASRHGETFGYGSRRSRPAAGWCCCRAAGRLPSARSRHRVSSRAPSTAVLPISWPRSGQGSGGGRSSCGSAASGLLRRGGERRVLARVLVDKPLLPLGRVVGPLFQLDAPCRRLGGQVEGLALGGRQATRDSCPGSRH